MIIRTLYKLVKMAARSPKSVHMSIFPIIHRLLIENLVVLHLLKRVRTKCGYVLSPIKVYSYKHLKKSIELQHLVKRKGFVDSCERWRAREVPEGFICDIFSMSCRFKGHTLELLYAHGYTQGECEAMRYMH